MYKKYTTAKHSVQSTSSELDKLEKTHKSELRMISTAAFKFRSKFIKVEDPRRWHGETEACNVRMYETHFPGFCYLKDGRYRRKVASNVNAKGADPLESTQKIKALLFTDNELDIQKVMCLHLLGTHVQNRRHIQRKDGKTALYYTRSQSQGNRRLTLQTVSQRFSTYETVKPSVYDEMLPRYVIDVRLVDRLFSSTSLYTSETDFYGDDEVGKRRRIQVAHLSVDLTNPITIKYTNTPAASLLVPIYVNNEIRAIVSSVLEALEAVNSSKLNELLALARDPDELKDLLSQSDIQEFMIELAGNQLVNRATAYDFTITHPIYEKIGDTAATETVAHVLEISSDSGLRNMLYLVRRTISRRYEELVLCNVLPGKKKRIAYHSGIEGFPTVVLGSEPRFNKCLMESTDRLKNESSSQMEVVNEAKSERTSHSSLNKRAKPWRKSMSQSLRSIYSFGNGAMDQNKTLTASDEIRNNEENSMLLANNSEIRVEESKMHQFGRFQDSDITKHDLRNLTNAQRILLGLKIASMKSRPVNMHQFENKKKIDVTSIITSIVRPMLADNGEMFNDDDVFGTEQKKVKRTMSKLGCSQVGELSNLSRTVLSNFRHEIATSENKKRVKEFLDAHL